VPARPAEVRVTAAAPVDVKVSVCATGVPTAELPNARLLALTLKPGVASSTSMLKSSVTPFELADSTTAWLLETAEMAALKLAVVAPAATVTDDGTETAALLLARFTTVPPAGEAELSVTLHESEPWLAIARLQEKALIAGTTITPVPLRATTVVPLDVELEVTVS
jgi:hypothetical protein